MSTTEPPNPLAIEFEKELTAYIAKNKPHVNILTPCYGGQCHVEYMMSLISSIDALRSLGIGISVQFCKNDSLVSRARNNLIARGMSDPNSTHFLFIDNDIVWDPISILKLLLADKNLIGGIYPLKNYFWDNLIEPNPEANAVKAMIDKKNASQLKEFIPDRDIIQHRLLKYNLNLLDGKMEIDRNLSRVKHIATGFMMIKRSTITKMFQAFPSTKYVDDISFLRPEENVNAYALFDCGVEDGHYYSEDWMFCSRWSKMGGEIWTDVSINLSHIGVEKYNGCYLATLI
jgi:hypothetical protein